MRAHLAFLAMMALDTSNVAIAARVDDRAAMAASVPKEIIVSPSMSADDQAALLVPINAFYGFWNNASQSLLNASVASTFIDHTLPVGRKQGPTGVAEAANAMLDAVPDLSVTVVQRLIVNDRVVSHLRFTGHFTGTFKGHMGRGQAIDFIATDILRVQSGKVTDNWHLEDNQTFMQQVGLAPKS